MNETYYIGLDVHKDSISIAAWIKVPYLGQHFGITHVALELILINGSHLA